jgi:predicted NACHT family NTPase
MISRVAFVLLVVTASTRLCAAADPRYPDWPCTQAKVPEISLAAVWAGPPLDDAEQKWKSDPKVSALVQKVAARKLPLEDAQKAITEFLAMPGTDKMATGKLLFAGLFEQLNAERASVMNGLERVTRRQRQAADKIREDTIALQALQGATPRDQAKIEELGNTLVWETRIFEDRHRVVKFVCEVPITIDQRLFALGRTIQQEIE